MWASRLSGSVRDRGTTRAMGDIMWHRRETRRQTEKTNFALTLGESSVYSKLPAPTSVRGYGWDERPRNALAKAYHATASLLKRGVARRY
jgi:hypothetical protein